MDSWQSSDKQTDKKKDTQKNSRTLDLKLRPHSVNGKATNFANVKVLSNVRSL